MPTSFFTVDNLKHLEIGDWMVLSIIGLCVFLFFRWRVPAVKSCLAKKVNKEDCEKVHEFLNTRLTIIDDNIKQNRELVLKEFDYLRTRLDGYFNGVKKGNHAN